MASMAIHKVIGRAKAMAFSVLAVLVAASFGVLLAADPAHAATFAVNSTADTQDANLANAACDVNASAKGNQCTLRAAIQEANDTSGADAIGFNIVSNAAVKTISPASGLPAIREAVTINGFTQPGASANTLATGNNAVLKVQLNGTNAGAETNGLAIRASNSTIKGLVINRFAGNGVLISGTRATGNKVEGSFIGTTADGSGELGNSGDGVLISGAPSNTVGGTAPAQRNVISSNRDGVEINGAGATRNKVLGNYIGTDDSGNRATEPGTGDQLGNSASGVLIEGAPTNTIGGTVSGARNIISGGVNDGLQIIGSGAARNKVEGNFIGTTADGSGPLGNGGDGVLISTEASNNTIGGTESGARNVISANGFNGVAIFSGGNKVLGNFIGWDVDGAADLGNTFNGVLIFGASNNTIGGLESGAGNSIAHNGDPTNADADDADGVSIASGGVGNSVLSNFIMSNAGLGIDLRGGDGVTANDVDLIGPNDDADTGPNNLQNFPEITSATRSATSPFFTIITGTLNSRPSQKFIIQCFLTDDAPASGHGEGLRLVDTASASTNAQGDGGFQCATQIPAAGQTVTATATRLDTSTETPRDTSEFSENQVVAQQLE